MPLVQATLESNLVTAWSEPFPANTQEAAERWANAYDHYAKQGQACSLLTPTVVNKPGLISGIKGAFDTGGDPATIAAAVAAAHETYWTGALFGATGSVLSIDGTSALESALASLWTSLTDSSADVATCAAQHAAALHTFTTTVKVVDTAVPPPSGCGPAPIS